MHSFITRASARPGLRLCSSAFGRSSRSQSSQPPSGSTEKQAHTPKSPVQAQDNSPKHFDSVLHAGKRFIRFSLIGTVLLGVAIGGVYEGAHIWAEKNGLAPETDQEVKKWQWESDADRWTGDPEQGGTDPGLGFKARHLLRAAWMAYTWGIGHNQAAIGTHNERDSGPLGPAGIKVINPQLQMTGQFLQSAIRLAESASDRLCPHTLPQLFTLHGTILEKLGADYLPEARSEFERAWAGLDGRGLSSARTALKLGDIISRTGPDEQALEWWARALQLINGKFSQNTSNPKELVPQQPPPSPLAQRLLSSTLVSLSAFYAKSGQYRMAESVEEQALSVLRAIPTPQSLSTASPPQALHALFLLQRSSILSIHLAEVQYAQRKFAMSSMQWLTFAAESSERVARALTGLPLTKTQEFHAKNSLPHPLEEQFVA
ncbi:hypothetical protein NP233_g10273 [Leucocoprinus birnbaumii]|uniref:Uncharacterized protein n=1 Tax=Leucocoprinus birnbaumii TaxID=56174 RepID=A0AAD5YQ10_9AGAR|nr:hypothetical protein NP233_g10273 [Leucocoprinus birnbaumii]